MHFYINTKQIIFSRTSQSQIINGFLVVTQGRAHDSEFTNKLTTLLFLLNIAFANSGVRHVTTVNNYCLQRNWCTLSPFNTPNKNRCPHFFLVLAESTQPCAGLLQFLDQQKQVLMPRGFAFSFKFLLHCSLYIQT